jgi:hypothetical protein
MVMIEKKDKDGNKIVLMNVREFCDSMRCDPDTIKRRLQQNGIGPSARRGKVDYYLLGRLIMATYPVTAKIVRH